MIRVDALEGCTPEKAREIVEAAGFPEPIVVTEQFAPDPDFPTVAFPNPEEPGAMDLAFATAEASECNIVIANDPDADRCAVGVPTSDGWRMLTGDDVGLLLGWWVAAAAAAQARSRVVRGAPWMWGTSHTCREAVQCPAWPQYTRIAHRADRRQAVQPDIRLDRRQLHAVA